MKIYAEHDFDDESENEAWISMVADESEYHYTESPTWKVEAYSYIVSELRKRND